MSEHAPLPPDRRSISFDDPEAPSPVFVPPPGGGALPTPSETQSISFDDPSAPSPLFAPPPGGGTPTPAAPLPETPFHQPLPPEEPSPQATALPAISFDDGQGGAPPAAPQPSTAETIGGRPNFTALEVPLRKPTIRERVWLPSLAQLVVVALGLGGWWLVRNFDRRLKVTEEHRALVLTADQLSTFLREETRVAGFDDGFTVRPDAEQLEVRRRLDGVLRLEYSYAPGGDDQPQLTVTTRIDRTVDGARDTFRWMEIKARADWRDAGGGAATIVELDDECSWGDESRASIVEVRGRPMGHGFTARRGKKSIHVMLQGVSLWSGEELRQLLDPVLRELGAFH